MRAEYYRVRQVACAIVIRNKKAAVKAARKQLRLSTTSHVTQIVSSDVFNISQACAQ